MIWQQNDHLFSAISIRGSFALDYLSQSLRNTVEHCIAFLMAMRIVDFLETINIDKYETKWLILSDSFCERGFQVFIERASIKYSRNFV